MSDSDESIGKAILGCLAVIGILIVLVALAGGAFWIWRMALER